MGSQLRSGKLKYVCYEIIGIDVLYLWANYTLKIPGSNCTRKGSLDARPTLGSDPTRKPGQTDPESESERHF